MFIDRRDLLAFLAATMLPSPWATAASSPDEKSIEDAYTYLLGRALVIRQEHIDRGGDSLAYNQIKYNPLGSADFVNPNFDVAYLEAWFAVDDRTPSSWKCPRSLGATTRHRFLTSGER